MVSVRLHDLIQVLARQGWVGVHTVCEYTGRDSWETYPKKGVIGLSARTLFGPTVWLMHACMRMGL